MWLVGVFYLKTRLKLWQLQPNDIAANIFSGYLITANNIFRLKLI